MDAGWFLGAALPATLPRHLCGNVPKRACCGIRFSDGRSVVIATDTATVHSGCTVAITTKRWAQFWFREQAPLATAPHMFGEGGAGGALLPEHHLRPHSPHQLQDAFLGAFWGSHRAERKGSARLVFWPRGLTNTPLGEYVSIAVSSGRNGARPAASMSLHQPSSALFRLL